MLVPIQMATYMEARIQQKNFNVTGFGYKRVDLSLEELKKH